jgi:hypothetical protein
VDAEVLGLRVAYLKICSQQVFHMTKKSETINRGLDSLTKFYPHSDPPGIEQISDHPHPVSLHETLDAKK